MSTGMKRARINVGFVRFALILIWSIYWFYHSIKTFNEFNSHRLRNHLNRRMGKKCCLVNKQTCTHNVIDVTMRIYTQLTESFRAVVERVGYVVDWQTFAWDSIKWMRLWCSPDSIHTLTQALHATFPWNHYERDLSVASSENKNRLVCVSVDAKRSFSPFFHYTAIDWVFHIPVCFGSRHCTFAANATLTSETTSKKITKELQRMLCLNLFQALLSISASFLLFFFFVARVNLSVQSFAISSIRQMYVTCHYTYSLEFLE